LRWDWSSSGVQAHGVPRGNHDERLWDAAGCDDGKIADFASYLILDVKDALGDIPVLPYDKRKGVYRLGHLAIHGYTAGITAAKRAAEIYGAVMMGHVHAIDAYSIAGASSVGWRGRSGRFASLGMDYNRAHANTLRQAHGWAYGLKFPNGDYTFWQAEEVGGSFYMPSRSCGDPGQCEAN
jgi:hypothetical protein